MKNVSKIKLIYIQKAYLNGHSKDRKSPILTCYIKTNGVYTLRKESCQRFYSQWVAVVLEIVK